MTTVKAIGIQRMQVNFMVVGMEQHLSTSVRLHAIAEIRRLREKCHDKNGPKCDCSDTKLRPQQ